LPPGHGSIDSVQMKPDEKQFSLNRAASKKQIPISSYQFSNGLLTYHNAGSWYAPPNLHEGEKP